MNLRLRTPQLIAALAAFPLLGGALCGDGAIVNPYFELWCEEKLCGWDLDAGSVEKAVTWHESDTGVALIGDHVVLSQLQRGHSQCLEVDLVTDRAEDVTLEFALDYLDDGSIDHRQIIDGTSFKHLNFRVRGPEWSSQVRFIVEKRGAGRAVLARVQAHDIDPAKCSGQPVDLGPMIEGGPCESETECKDGLACRGTFAAGASLKTCGGCSSDAECASAEVCTLTSHGLFDVQALCGPPPQKALGLSCIGDRECASGLCADGMCAECRADSCGSGRSCELSETGALYRPRLCMPASGDGREAGEGCFLAGDCKSGACLPPAAIPKVCSISSVSCQRDMDCARYELGDACRAPLRVLGVCR